MRSQSPRGLNVGYIEGPSESWMVTMCSQTSVNAQNRLVPLNAYRAIVPGLILRADRRSLSIGSLPDACFEILRTATQKLSIDDRR